jgi:hypothetical protein
VVLAVAPLSVRQVVEQLVDLQVVEALPVERAAAREFPRLPLQVYLQEPLVLPSKL